MSISFRDAILPYTHNYTLRTEYNLLSKYHISGLYIFPGEGNEADWFGVISVRSGYFRGGIFELKIVIPPDYPSGRTPRIFLPVGFFHPNINQETGEFDSTIYFPMWKPGHSRVWQLLHHFARSLSNPTCEQNNLQIDRTLCKEMSSLGESTGDMYANPKAAKLLAKCPSEFKSEAKRCVTQLSLWAESNVLRFDFGRYRVDITGWKDDEFVEKARKQLHHSIQDSFDSNVWPTKAPQGYSWIDPKSMAIFAARSVNTTTE